ncbi:hypothetical protein COO60DRAFT_1539618 [Scenedesmus sp. NREL 46B-D3]|nr:hypothetical protein COO60DRAFT_1539618 [Scenedesmus sp. NREL 46B-D3]
MLGLWQAGLLRLRLFTRLAALGSCPVVCNRALPASLLLRVAVVVASVADTAASMPWVMTLTWLNVDSMYCSRQCAAQALRQWPRVYGGTFHHTYCGSASAVLTNLKPCIVLNGALERPHN